VAEQDAAFRHNFDHLFCVRDRNQHAAAGFEIQCGAFQATDEDPKNGRRYKFSPFPLLRNLSKGFVHLIVSQIRRSLSIFIAILCKVAGRGGKGGDCGTLIGRLEVPCCREER
jgi:hypothetical protein